MKKFILAVLLLTCAIQTQAQDFIDNALLFSRTLPGGSARMQGIGGAQVSLGGDYSSAFSNPAGLGMYNKSEFAFSTGLRFANSSSSYFGTSSDDKRNSFNIPGLSFAFHLPSPNDEGFLGGTFAVTLNRINDFNQNYSFSGINNKNSIIHSFVEDANGVYYNGEILDPGYLGYPEDGFYTLTGLAFNNFLIDTLRDVDGNLYYDSPLTVFWDESGENGSVRQTEISERKGAQNQWSIAYGANFSDKFFVGASIGITSLRFKLKQIYREESYQLNNPNDAGYDPLKSFEIEETYDIEGNGFNFNVGMIYRPIDRIQLGASFSTPTAYSITDTYSASIRSSWNNFDYYSDGSQVLNDVDERFDVPFISEYDLRTPMRLNTGVTYITKKGFISTDLEFINYSKGKYDAEDESYSFENDEIKASYKSVINYRVGGEYRLGEWRFRGGVNLMADPNKNGRVNQRQNIFSVGAGYHTADFFIDLAILHSQTKGTRIPYFADAFTPVANQTFRATSAIITVGFPIR